MAHISKGSFCWQGSFDEAHVNLLSKRCPSVSFVVVIITLGDSCTLSLVTVPKSYYISYAQFPIQARPHLKENRLPTLHDVSRWVIPGESKDGHSKLEADPLLAPVPASGTVVRVASELYVSQGPAEEFAAQE